MERVLFNLWLNTSLSFLGGAVLVWLFITVSRVRSPRWRVYWLSLPFIKVLVDLCRGLPDGAFALSNMDVFNLPVGYGRQGFMAVAASYFGPFLKAGFWIEDAQGARHAMSLADWAGAWLVREGGITTLRMVLLIAIGIAVLFVLRRVIGWGVWELARRSKVSRGEWQIIQRAPLGRRNFSCFISDHEQGSPFSGGTIHPWICFPRDVWDSMTDDQRHVVIAHECAHLSTFDHLQAMAIQLLTDVCWCLPGYSWHGKALERARESLADDAAIRSGSSRETLAEALLLVGSRFLIVPRPGLCSSLTKHRSTIAARVRYLVEPDRRTLAAGRFSWTTALLVLLGTVFVLCSSIGGNFGVESVEVKSWSDVFHGR